MDGLKRLEDIAFRHVGYWRLASGGPEFTLLSDAAAENVLYAFVSDRDVLYVGKTTQRLSNRMYGYQCPGRTQRTNIAGRQHIEEHLSSGRAVEIYALRDDTPRTHGSFTLNLAAGLEDSILRALQPPWNAIGK